MDLETFLVAVYCVTDDALRTMLHGARLRQRGPAPRLADSEVVTMEVAGEFLGHATDAGIYRYFRRHHGALFPALATVHRTTFLRQAANLWAVKRALWQALVPRLRGDPQLSIVDSVPVPVCRFARAKQCHLYPGVAAYGRDPCLPGTFFGLRAHLRVTWPGVIAGFELAPANRADLALAPSSWPARRGGRSATARTGAPTSASGCAPAASSCSRRSRRARTSAPPGRGGWSTRAAASRPCSRNWWSGTGRSGRGPATCGTCNRAGCARCSATRRPCCSANSTASARSPSVSSSRPEKPAHRAR